MNIKTFLVTSIAASFSMFIFAGLWHELAMAAFYESETHATHGGTGIIFLAYLVLGILMTYFYYLVFKEKQPWKSNLKFGILVGLLWVFPHELAMAGAHDTSILYVIENAIWHMVEQGIGGITLGVVFWNVSIK